MQIEVNGTLRNSRVLFSDSDIKVRVAELAHQINTEYGKQETLVVLIVLNGALLFAADLVRHLSMPTEVETVRIKSYEGTKSSGHIALLTELPSFKNQHVLLIEDIVDTGRSIAFLREKILKESSAKSLKICSFLSKPESHELPLSLEYVGFNIGKNFVIGYGLDLDGKYRNLPFVAEII